jgi:hypothetical protein
MLAVNPEPDEFAMTSPYPFRLDIAFASICIREDTPSGLTGAGMGVYYTLKGTHHV